MARKLFVDTDIGRFVQGTNSSVPDDLDNLFSGDNVPYELYFLQTNAKGDSVYTTVDNSALAVKLAIGPNPPSSASAYVSQNTWADGSTAVSATITKTITGGVLLNEQQTLAFSTNVSDGTYSLTFPNRSVVLTSITRGLFTTSGSHGLAILEPFVCVGNTAATGFDNGDTLYVTRLKAPNSFYASSSPTGSSGTYQSFSALTAGSIYTVTATSTAIPVRSNPETVKSILEKVPSIGGNNINVSGTLGKTYTMLYQGAKQQFAFPLATVTGSLVPLYFKTASLNFATTALTNAISASATIDATIEVQLTNGTEVTTVIQRPVTIYKDIIS